MIDGLVKGLSALSQQMRNGYSELDDVAFNAADVAMRTRIATKYIQEAADAAIQLSQAITPLIPAPPAPLQHRPQYGHVPPIEERYAEDQFPRVAQNWPDHRRAS